MICSRIQRSSTCTSTTRDVGAGLRRYVEAADQKPAPPTWGFVVADGVVACGALVVPAAGVVFGDCGVTLLSPQAVAPTPMMATNATAATRRNILLVVLTLTWFIWSSWIIFRRIYEGIRRTDHHFRKKFAARARRYQTPGTNLHRTCRAHASTRAPAAG